MLSRIILVVVLVLGVGLAVIASRSDTFEVKRVTTVSASPSAVFDELGNFRRWQAWSPWAKLDPAMTTTYSGPDHGIGQVYDWTGNDDVGAGRMTITRYNPPESLEIQLDFRKPFENSCITTFSLEPLTGGTQVTWTMTGRNGFIGKAMGLIMPMDKMVGSDFEKGLAQLKQVTESEVGKASAMAPAP